MATVNILRSQDLLIDDISSREDVTVHFCHLSPIDETDDQRAIIAKNFSKLRILNMLDVQSLSLSQYLLKFQCFSPAVSHLENVLCLYINVAEVGRNYDGSFSKCLRYMSSLKTLIMRGNTDMISLKSKAEIKFKAEDIVHVDKVTFQFNIFPAEEFLKLNGRDSPVRFQASTTLKSRRLCKLFVMQNCKASLFETNIIVAPRHIDLVNWNEFLCYLIHETPAKRAFLSQY